MAFFNEVLDKRMKPKCLMCEGDLEKANASNICNICKDKLRKNK